MFGKNIISFICIFVAGVIAAVHNVSHSVTESDPELSVCRLPIGKPESPVAVDLPSLLDAGEDAIVTIAAGDTHLVAHRAVLAAGSPVLAAMLGDGRPGTSSGQIAVPDLEGPVLRQLVAYLYTLQAPQLPEMAPQLLAAADKYGVSSLKAASARQVANEVTVENAAAALALAVRHSCEGLRQAVIPYVKANLALVVNTQAWADVASEVSWLFPELPAETSTPAPVDSGTTPTTDPDSDHSDHGRTPASAGQTTAVRHSPPPDAIAVSLLHTPAPAEGRTNPATQPHSSPASAGQTIAVRHISPPDAVAVSLLNSPAPAASGAAPTTQPHSDHSGQTRASTAPPTTTHRIARPDYAAVCPLWSLSVDEKNRRLMEAAKDGAVQDVEALLGAGADVGAGDEDGYTALHWAAIRGHVEVARRLLAAGAAVEARDSKQSTLLHYAAFWGQAAVVRLLVEEGSADVNARAWNGCTPLHLATIRGSAETAAVLLQAGADRGAADNYGRTPLDVARLFKKQHLIDMLKASS